VDKEFCTPFGGSAMDSSFVAFNPAQYRCCILNDYWCVDFDCGISDDRSCLHLDESLGTLT
jgi:hypothetical protein